ncbi:SDR family NAD(P)-dependent oxidoreductase, partial [Pseudomonas syringae pv. tagetis]
MTAPSVLIAGCGDIGALLATRLLPHGWVVHGLRSTVSELPAGVRGVQCDLFEAQQHAQWPAAALDYVVY